MLINDKMPDKMTAEERLEHNLRFNPDIFYKNWRFARWKERMAEERKRHDFQVRYEQCCQMIREGRWR